MATTPEYVLYVCDQIAGVGQVRCRKMFGEYMVYVNDRPVFTVCDNTVYVKMLDCVKDELAAAELDAPYPGAKSHYILDIDDNALAKRVAAILAVNISLPKPRKKKQKTGGKTT
ncbi:MAG: TfoX/Sxy family protein [Clostridiales bacterium]|nr:TfoX/Sxy family protein [Clostridiales bacterium]